MKIIYCWIIVGLLTSCGLKPLYNKEENGTVYQLSDIYVSSIEGRQGQILRNRLLSFLTPYGIVNKPKYILKITLRDTIENLGILKDATTSLTQYNYYVDFSLIERCSRKTLFSSKMQATANYSTISAAPFSTLVEAEFAKEKAIEGMAYDIRRKVAAYFLLKNSKEKDILEEHSLESKKDGE